MRQPSIRDISEISDQLVELDPKELMPLPYPYDDRDAQADLKQLTEAQKKRLDASLDGFSALQMTLPQTKEEEDEFVRKFVTGVGKLLSEDDNWAFLGPLMLRLDYCAKCQTCAESCQVFTGSGRQEIYRPNYRSELLRRIIKKYYTPGGKLLSRFNGADIDVNYQTVARLAELAYRCTLCRRCAKDCPIGIGNAMITREIRKVFSQEMGIAPMELHKGGTVKHLATGSSTGMTTPAFLDLVEFMEEEVEEKTGMRFKWPVDKQGADVLLIHNAGEFMAWPENPEAFAIIFEKAGVNYTLSSELLGYDAVNYGLWYDDVQFSRIALKHLQVAKKLGVKKIVIGECGHAHKALTVIADRITPEGLETPRESSYTFLADLVESGRLGKLDPSRNNFPTTLHDPCNIVRLMGIVDPQRRIVKAVTPPGSFREMAPHGVENYCCGGGSGFAIMNALNFADWRNAVSGRMKFKQILEAFGPELAPGKIDPSQPKYVVAPCSNCKGQMRGTFEYFDATAKTGIRYTGLVELIVNAMVDIEQPFLNPDAEF
ncbi:MAG: (Fe-S)-binding protein [Chloroflexota bacterium]